MSAVDLERAMVESGMTATEVEAALHREKVLLMKLLESTLSEDELEQAFKMDFDELAPALSSTSLSFTSLNVPVPESSHKAQQGAPSKGKGKKKVTVPISWLPKAFPFVKNWSCKNWKKSIGELLLGILK